MTPTLAVVALLICAGASFFFALAESALFTLGKWQVRQLAEKSPKGATIERLLAEPQDVLATIVLGNTMANGAMVASILWVAVYETWPLPITVLLLLVFALIGTEVAPKSLAVRAPEFWAVRVAGPLSLLRSLTRPLRQIAQKTNNALLALTISKTLKPQVGLSDEEYQELLELAYQQGNLAQSEKEIILQIISLDRRTASDVMLPRSQMACISDDLSVEEMIAAARRLRHTRIPIYDETPDTIVGVLNTRVLLVEPNVDLADAIEFPSFVPASMNLLQLLKSLQRQHRGMAIVLDEFGGTAGIVTLEDILGEIVGEIRGEGEAPGFVLEKLEAGRWRVNGSMRIEDFRREYPELGEVDGVDTMGGLLIRQLEVLPHPGENVVLRGIRLTAQVVEERRVKELLVEVIKRR
jgi:putative hemolysin